MQEKVTDILSGSMVFEFRIQGKHGYGSHWIRIPEKICLVLICLCKKIPIFIFCFFNVIFGVHFTTPLHMLKYPFLIIVNMIYSAVAGLFFSLAFLCINEILCVTFLIFSSVLCPDGGFCVFITITIASPKNFCILFVGKVFAIVLFSFSCPLLILFSLCCSATWRWCWSRAATTALSAPSSIPWATLPRLCSRRAWPSVLTGPSLRYMLKEGMAKGVDWSSCKVYAQGGHGQVCGLVQL